MEHKKIHVFTDIDIDGVASLLALHWALGRKPGELTFNTTTVGNFRLEFLKWLETDSIHNYDAVYFLDLDVSTCIDLVDNERSIILDHHLTHVNAKDCYKLATVDIVEMSSAVKLVYKHFPQLASLTNEQKYIIALANDYDCYQLKLPDSYNLNCLYSNTHKTLDKTRTHKFIERFYNGFNGFNAQESNIIKEFITRRDKTISTLQVYSGTVSIAKKECKVMGVVGVKDVNDFARFINEISDNLIKRGADIAFVLNTNNQHVSWRKSKTCAVDLSKLATALCNGGGHEYAAGGVVTEAFLEFTKQLNQEGI